MPAFASSNRRTQPRVAAEEYLGGTTITQWNPEDTGFWSTTGQRVAWRNLYCSMPALFMAFAVWMVWSTVVVKLKPIGFPFSDSQLFWLTALPGISGGTLRIFYSFLVPIMGGRNFTVLSTASLLLPAVGMGLAVQNPATPYWVFVVLALLAGLGGGNFASSMANISFFFPKSQKGMALGLNAGLGNLGVSAVQFLALAVIPAAMFGQIGGSGQDIAGGGRVYVQNIAFVWIVPLVLSCAAAWFLMNNLATARSSFREQSVIFRRKHNWIMCWLYVGTFGSFIGYSAGLTMLIKTQFAEVDPLKYAFIGPLVGALIRPLGGWMSDRVGGAVVTFWNFVLMTAAVFGVMHFLEHRENEGAFRGFLTMFILLFATTGIGNGSTFRMVPSIFATLHERAAGGDVGKLARAQREAAREGAAVLGFSSAMGAFGAAIIPLMFGWAIKATGSPFAALWGFIAFYISCTGITWWYYYRRGAEVPC